MNCGTIKSTRILFYFSINKQINKRKTPRTPLRQSERGKEAVTTIIIIVPVLKKGEATETKMENKRKLISASSLLSLSEANAKQYKEEKRIGETEYDEPAPTSSNNNNNTLELSLTYQDSTYDAFSALVVDMWWWPHSFLNISISVILMSKLYVMFFLFIGWEIIEYIQYRVFKRYILTSLIFDSETRRYILEKIKSLFCLSHSKPRIIKREEASRLRAGERLDPYRIHSLRSIRVIPSVMMESGNGNDQPPGKPEKKKSTKKMVYETARKTGIVMRILYHDSLRRIRKIAKKISNNFGPRSMHRNKVSGVSEVKQEKWYDVAYDILAGICAVLLVWNLTASRGYPDYMGGAFQLRHFVQILILIVIFSNSGQRRGWSVSIVLFLACIVAFHAWNLGSATKKESGAGLFPLETEIYAVWALLGITLSLYYMYPAFHYAFNYFSWFFLTNWVIRVFIAKDQNSGLAILYAFCFLYLPLSMAFITVNFASRHKKKVLDELKNKLTYSR